MNWLKLKAKLYPWRRYISDKTIDIRETKYYKSAYFERCKIRVFYPAQLNLSGRHNVFIDTHVTGVSEIDIFGQPCEGLGMKDKQ